ncbi:hypothetical protein [Anoxybacteroides tepidamans]|uniref:hypothetical protein n=1 Tax=Anoxybacteroides tepidamans TaxID=265948 RepID=UPI0012EB7E81|nr:hypothetical protein [Anoxybacillus tepidamans]
MEKDRESMYNKHYRLFLPWDIDQTPTHGTTTDESPFSSNADRTSLQLNNTIWREPVAVRTNPSCRYYLRQL